MRKLLFFVLGLGIACLAASNLAAECYEVTGSNIDLVDGIYYEWQLCEHRNMDGEDDDPDRGPTVPVMSYHKPGTDLKLGFRGCSGMQIAWWIIATDSRSTCAIFTETGPPMYYARNPGDPDLIAYPYTEIPPSTPYIPEGYCYDVNDPATGWCYNPRVVPYLPAPTADSAGTIRCTSFVARWLEPDCPPDGYRLDVATDSGFTSFVPGYRNLNVYGARSHTVNGLTAGTPYYYRVRAYWTRTGTESGHSAFAGLTTLPPPPPPGTLTFSSETMTVIQVDWTANGNPDGTQYLCENVDRGTDSGWITGMSWTSSGLACETAYGFQARARNGEGVESASTAIYTGTTAACPEPGQLAVTPDEGLISSGIDGGPFDPSSGTFRLTNTGGSPLAWTASSDQPWVTFSSDSGTLATGADVDVGISINSAADGLAPGSHTATITFADTTNSGIHTRSWSLAVLARGALSVDPQTGHESEGYENGPFSPSSQQYTLANTGATSIEWTAASQQDWVTLSTAGGTLAAGAVATVDVAVNNAAEALAPGSYDDSVVFTNTTNGSGNTTRSVRLTVNDRDTDDDGVEDLEEAAGPNGGDCNADGQPDSRQSHVACIAGSDAQTYVVVSTAGGMALQGCDLVTNPNPDDCPDWVSFPYGFFQFTISGVAPGGPASVTIRLADGAAPDNYYKYGPIPGAPTAQWYRFKYENSLGVGARFNGNEITLHYVDGGLGDDDLTADGIIRDPGGPGVMMGGSGNNAPAAMPAGSSGGGGGGCWIDTLAALR